MTIAHHSFKGSDESTLDRENQSSNINAGFMYQRQVESSKIATEGKELLLNILLNSCINCKQVGKAIQIVETLLSEKNKTNFFKVDEVSFNTLIKGCAQERMADKSKQLFN